LWEKERALRSKSKTFPYPLEYAKDKNVIGIKEISGEWPRDNFSVFSKGQVPRLPCKGVHRSPQLSLHEVNGVYTEKYNRSMIGYAVF